MTKATPTTGITVIIVGLGIAGLTAAIECHRQGHEVIGLEKKSTVYQLGDLIGLSENGLKVLSQWPTANGTSVASTLTSLGSELSSVEIFSSAGELKYSIPFGADSPVAGLFLRRSDLVEALYQYATSDLRLDLRYGVAVEEYWETATTAGVVVQGAERISGHCVIGTDGIYSKTRAVITGDSPEADTATLLETGGAIFRSTFDASVIATDPDAQWVLQGVSAHDRHEIYLGKDVTILMGTMAKGKYVWWNCSHRDPTKATTNWVQAASITPVLKYIRDWPIANKLSAVIAKTPQGKCFNHSLVTRKPIRTWVSRQGRMAVIGDAAHQFLPHTGQGANQAIEDAAVVAVCLRLASLSKDSRTPKSDGVPLALRVMEKLRYRRVSLIQEGSVEAQEVTLEGDMDTGTSGDRFNAISRPAWIHCHDCISHTHEEFAKVVDALSKRDADAYVPTNAPVDGLFHAEDDYILRGKGSL
ncbi:TqaE [Penicillium digitatum]|uniref:TqaE n=1 Tax=Penicillium digitatum TaxID=36651 RepID=A0A7T6XSK1_PENDI|nr:TqaE [Penicillium digitatum]